MRNPSLARAGLVLCSLLLAVLLLMALISPALAGDDTVVTIPIGDWINSIAGPAAAAFLGIGLWLLRRLPEQAQAWLMMIRIEQLLERAIDFAINAVENATRDKEFNVAVGHAVAAQALQYVIDRIPEFLLIWIGGTERLFEMIWARLPLEPQAKLNRVEMGHSIDMLRR